MHTRPVYFSDEGFRDTPVYAQATLQATHVVRGPAIVEQLDATTVIFPGQEAAVDIYGNLLIHLLRS
jgi:N-methylhydantoinase A